jgi:hypothetical protein
MEIRNVANTASVGTAIQRASEKWGDNITAKNGITVTAHRRNGNYNVRVALRAISSHGDGTRESWSGRRGPWVCWHANRDFFRALFALEPGAVVRTGLGRNGVTYTAANFENEFPRTYNVNAGSMLYPREFGTLCGHGGREATANRY